MSNIEEEDLERMAESVDAQGLAVAISQRFDVANFAMAADDELGSAVPKTEEVAEEAKTMSEVTK